MDIFVKYIELLNKRSDINIMTTHIDVSLVYTHSYNFW